MKAIAERAEVTQSLLHHHFGLKSHLWTAVQESGFQDVLRAMRPVVSRAVNSAELPVVLFTVYFDFLKEHPEYVKLLGWTYVTADGDQRSLPGQATQLVEVIRSLQNEGKLNREIAPSVYLTLIWSLAEGWFLGRKDFERRLGHPPEGEAMVERYREGAICTIRKAMSP